MILLIKGFFGLNRVRQICQITRIFEIRVMHDSDPSLISKVDFLEDCLFLLKVEYLYLVMLLRYFINVISMYQKLPVIYLF